MYVIEIVLLENILVALRNGAFTLVLNFAFDRFIDVASNHSVNGLCRIGSSGQAAIAESVRLHATANT